MNERIKKVRKALDLTQQEFANRIGSVQNTITGYETGRRVPSGQVITLICKTFNVNETWLRTGEGEMFNKTPDSIAGQLAAEFGLDEFLQSVVSEYLRLNAEQRQTVRDFVSSIASEMPPSAPAFAPAHTPTIEEEARSEAEEYYCQILAEKERAARSQALPDGTGSDTPKMA